MSLELVILAAGQGKRMHSDLPKVLHCVGGKPMLAHLLDTVSQLNPDAIHIVVGHGKGRIIEDIENRLSSTKNLINWVEQSDQLGTGHAVMQALPHIDPKNPVMILNGDVPLISLETLISISKPGNNLNLLTVITPKPFGLGRIVRNKADEIIGIVEEKDADEDQKKIQEVNLNCLCAKASHLSDWLPSIECNNAQKEYYLTDAVACAVASKIKIVGIDANSVSETLGVNSKSDLSKLERIYQNNVAEILMASGVSILDPNRFDLRGTCKFGTDCLLDINVILEGNVEFGDDVKVGPNTVIRNSSIGDGCVIEANSVIDNAKIGKNCNIGPFARIRPETTLEDGVRIGNFVEIKKSNIKSKSKVNHLSYVGDSELGSNVNVGAGVITCNYDGANKHKTVIGNDVFVGSDSQLIAPVEIGDGATIGAGSTITDHVKAGNLAVSRGNQRSIENWRRPKRN